MVRADGVAFGLTRCRHGGEFEEALKHQLHAEIVHCTAEEDGHLLAFKHFCYVKFFGNAIEKIDFLHGSIVNLGVDLIFDGLILDAGHGERRFERSVGSALKEIHSVLLAVKDSSKARSITKRPI